MNWKKFKEIIKTIGDTCSIGWLIICFVFVVLGIFHIIFKVNNKPNTTSNPISTIDSIKISNEILIKDINNLDSIKNAKVIEVETMDNDSILMLFYQLIGN